ncbi:hypothetical protein VNO77_34510 [Canavalia gladiata]|uniref:Uncharacterized protein n=1 Tax=Canavalia gladiata TaxID=3824 RepID=A0AAN9KGP1_CANGL
MKSLAAFWAGHCTTYLAIYLEGAKDGPFNSLIKVISRPVCPPRSFVPIGIVIKYRLLCISPATFSRIINCKPVPSRTSSSILRMHALRRPTVLVQHTTVTAVTKECVDIFLDPTSPTPIGYGVHASTSIIRTSIAIEISCGILLRSVFPSSALAHSVAK